MLLVPNWLKSLKKQTLNLIFSTQTWYDIKFFSFRPIFFFQADFFTPCIRISIRIRMEADADSHCWTLGWKLQHFFISFEQARTFPSPCGPSCWWRPCWSPRWGTSSPSPGCSTAGSDYEPEKKTSVDNSFLFSWMFLPLSQPVFAEPTIFEKLKNTLN